MAIAFGGEFRVRQTKEQVYDFLTDPNRFAPLLPDFQSLSVDDEKNCTVKVKVGISHIRGVATVKLRLGEAERPRRAFYQGKGSLAGGTVNFTAGFDLEEDSGGTRVRWKGEAQIFGRLTSVAGGLLEPLGRKSVQKLVDGLETALS
ncbi:MAG: CoxG family protein [Terriglobia bacterium]